MKDDDLRIFIGSKIRYYRKAHKMTQTELAKKIGVAKTTISGYEKGYRSPLQSTLLKISNVFNISVDELFPPTTDNETAQTINKKRLNANYDKLNSNNQNKLVNYSIDLLRDQISVVDETLFKYIFFDNALSAGTGQYLSEGQKETIELPIDIDCDFVAPVAGDSMLPEYQSGDFVFIKLTYNLQNNDIGVFVVDGDAYIKQFQIIDNRYYLHSLNPNYSDIEVTNTTDFRIIGKVVARYPN